MTKCHTRGYTVRNIFVHLFDRMLIYTRGNSVLWPSYCWISKKERKTCVRIHSHNSISARSRSYKFRFRIKDACKSSRHHSGFLADFFIIIVSNIHILLVFQSLEFYFHLIFISFRSCLYDV